MKTEILEEFLKKAKVKIIDGENVLPSPNQSNALLKVDCVNKDIITQYIQADTDMENNKMVITEQKILEYGFREIKHYDDNKEELIYNINREQTMVVFQVKNQKLYMDKYSIEQEIKGISLGSSDYILPSFHKVEDFYDDNKLDSALARPKIVRKIYTVPPGYNIMQGFNTIDEKSQTEKAPQKVKKYNS